MTSFYENAPIGTNRMAAVVYSLETTPDKTHLRLPLQFSLCPVSVLDSQGALPSRDRTERPLLLDAYVPRQRDSHENSTIGESIKLI